MLLVGHRLQYALVQHLCIFSSDIFPWWGIYVMLGERALSDTFQLLVLHTNFTPMGFGLVVGMLIVLVFYFFGVLVLLA